MKKYSLLILLLLSAAEMFSQRIPSEYSVLPNRLEKVTDNSPSTQSSNTVERILISGNTILLGTGNGLSRSTDNGVSWTNYYNSKDFGTDAVSAVGIYNGVIWAATWQSQSINGSVIGVGTGLKYSTDNGTTWTSISQPVDAVTDTLLTYGNNILKANPTTVPQENFIYDMAFTRNTIWYAAKAGGLRKSTDMGKTWLKVILPPDNINSIKPTDLLSFKYDPAVNLNHLAFSVLALDDQTILVGTANGINKSTDGGISWTKFNHSNQTKSISGNFILSLKKNDFDNSIWAGTWKANGQTEFYGGSVSKDGGLSWENFLSGENIHDFGFNYIGSAGNYTGVEILAATESGVFWSSNYGASWIKAPLIKDDITGVALSTTQFLSVKASKRGDSSTDVWIGSNDGMARLNTTTGLWNGSWKVFLASQSLNTASDSYCFPNPFSPGKRITRIKYSTSQSSSVTIRILDFGMNLVRTLIQNVSKSANSENFEIWDGRDDSSRIVSNGVYFYRIDIGTDKPLFGKIMVVK